MRDLYATIVGLVLGVFVTLMAHAQCTVFPTSNAPAFMPAPKFATPFVATSPTNWHWPSATVLANNGYQPIANVDPTSRTYQTPFSVAFCNVFMVTTQIDAGYLQVFVYGVHFHSWQSKGTVHRYYDEGTWLESMILTTDPQGQYTAQDSNGQIIPCVAGNLTVQGEFTCEANTVPKGTYYATVTGVEYSTNPIPYYPSYFLGYQAVASYPSAPPQQPPN
jgi:hypothetical protein